MASAYPWMLARVQVLQLNCKLLTLHKSFRFTFSTCGTWNIYNENLENDYQCSFDGCRRYMHSKRNSVLCDLNSTRVSKPVNFSEFHQCTINERNLHTNRKFGFGTAKILSLVNFDAFNQCNINKRNLHTNRKLEFGDNTILSRAFPQCSINVKRCYIHRNRKLGFDALNASQIPKKVDLNAVEFNTQLYQGLKTSAIILAGHSKWANIRHIKGAKDEIKSSIRQSVTKRIQGTIRETGVADPKYNNTLARLITEARSQNIPNSTIENVIKAALIAREKTVTMTFEGMGPGNCVIVVEIATHHTHATKNEIVSMFKKSGIRMTDSSLSKITFDHKGFVDVGIDSKEDLDLDKYVDMAILAGAENVGVQKYEGTEDIFLRFECDPSEIYIVESKLTKQGLDILDCVSEYVPKTIVDLSEEEISQIKKFCDKLRASFNVENISINADMET